MYIFLCKNLSKLSWKFQLQFDIKDKDLKNMIKHVRCILMKDDINGMKKYVYSKKNEMVFIKYKSFILKIRLKAKKYLTRMMKALFFSI